MNQQIKTFLMISLIVNALFIGMILGETFHLFSHHVEQYMITAQPNNSCCSSALDARLSQDKRKLLNDILHPAWEKMQAARANFDEEKKKALTLLKAEPFDEKAYRAQVHHMNEIHNQMKQDMAETIIKIATQFTAEDRVVLADIVSHLSTSPSATPAAKQ